MKSYWFYLKPYTFLWGNTSIALIYNSVSGEGVEINKSGEVGNIIEHLQDHSNGYCIEISEKDKNKPDINTLISSVKSSFSGDLIETSGQKAQPVIFPPKLKINKDINILKADPKRSVGENILSYLDDVSIYINGECSLTCKHCKSSYRQIACCTKSRHSLGFEKIKGFVSQIQGGKVSQINIL